MHVANLPDIDKKIDRVINFGACAVPRLDWSALPQPPAARLLSEESELNAKRELLTAAQWPDYQTAKRTAAALLPPDKYAEFYDCVRKASLAD